MQGKYVPTVLSMVPVAFYFKCTLEATEEFFPQKSEEVYAIELCKFSTLAISLSRLGNWKFANSRSHGWESD